MEVTYRDEGFVHTSIGMGDGRQTMKVLQLANNAKPDSPMRFAGVDLFESAPQPSQHLRLKEVMHVR